MSAAGASRGAATRASSGRRGLGERASIDAWVLRKWLLQKQGSGLHRRRRVQRQGNVGARNSTFATLVRDGLLKRATNRLKKQQDKLLTTERYEAWETVARKLAHEIKNPLTPIQLSIDRLREKYSSKINEGSQDFERYLDTINRQIKDIESLVNEFSSFARMPRPIFKKINIIEIIKKSLNFVKISPENQINFTNKESEIIINGDREQLNRVFINLIKNSEEAFLDLSQKNIDFKGKIDIDIVSNNDYIVVKLTDNGTGLTDPKKAMTPYFTTKSNGTGLGLPIVNKIINEHSGNFFIKNKIEGNGVDIEISFPKIDA